MTPSPEKMSPRRFRRRALLRHLAASGLLGSAGVLGLIRQALAANPASMAQGLHPFRGQVTVNGVPARQGRRIGSGDTVATAAGAEAIYVIGQDAFLQRADSRVSFAGGAVPKLLRVVTGRLLSVFGAGEKTIRVPTAAIGIRGTACYIEAEPSRTYFCLCYGEAEIVPTAKPEQREAIITRHHDHPLYIHADPAMPTAMVPAEVINHTDAELTMLESLVGRRPPFDPADVRY